jgi:DNA adenine methylase
MIYLGSKNRISKHILPIMVNAANDRGITTWVEPFVGGGNMIDKVPDSFKRIGIDVNPHAINALIAIRDHVDKLPTIVSEAYYKEIKKTDPDPITSWIRFVCSFGGKFENGYARNKKKQNYANAGVNNAKRQTTHLQDVTFFTGSYEQFSHLDNCLIYCDPPYEGTTKYKTDNFEHDKFWQWCRKMSENNLVFVSEYIAPDDFKCVWEGGLKTNFAHKRDKATHVATEKLFCLY